MQKKGNHEGHEGSRRKSNSWVPSRTLVSFVVITLVFGTTGFLAVRALRDLQRDLHSDLLDDLPEGRNLVESQSNFLLREIYGAHVGSLIAHCSVHFCGGGRVETLRDDHTVVSPMLYEHRSFFGHDLCPRNGAVRSAARCGRLRGCGLITLSDCRSIKARETFGGLGRGPARNIEKREVGRGRGCCTCGFVLATESYVRAALPCGRNVVRNSARAVLLQ